MSKYTTEVRYICESLAPNPNNRGDAFEIQNGQWSVNKIIERSWNKVFNFDFPIWDENYRSVLCTKILKHYYTREIGLETVGLWKLKLETKLNEIMPYYNELYKTTTMKYNPLYDADYYRTTNGNEHGSSNHDEAIGRHSTNSNGESYSEVNRTEGENHGKNRFSDTPQGGLIGIENDEYLTNVTLTDNEGTTVNNRTGNRDGNGKTDENSTRAGSDAFATTKDYVEHIAGKFPGRSYAKNIKEFRENLLNIDMMVIDELKDLFMLLW